MPNTFKNASVINSGVSTRTDVYTCPALTTSVVFTAYFSNITVSPTNVTVEVYDDSGTAHKVIGKDLPIPVSSTLEFGKISLETGDKVVITSQNDASVEAFLNILEIT